MRIAFCISPNDTVPQTTEKILAPWVLAEQLIWGLVGRGHQVSVFCAEGSQVVGRMVTLGIKPYFWQKNVLGTGAYYRMAIFSEQRLVGEAVTMANAGEFDLIHVFHGTLRVLPILRFAKVPVVCTIHDPFNTPERWMYEAFADLPNVHYVALSQSHLSEAGGLPVTGVVYNGIDVEKIPFVSSIGERLLIAGRIKPEKGFADAIAAARTASVPLILAGEHLPDQAADAAYWREKVAPQIDGHLISHRGFVKTPALYDLYGQSQALLFPIKWAEPFGMVMVEAMAAGTPVIAYNRGSVPEIVKDGVTGFVVNDDLSNEKLVIKQTGISGLVEAVRRIREIDRASCRRHVAENFSMEKMVAGYEKIYQSVR